MKLKKWEIALIMAIGVTLIYGAGLMRQQQRLSDNLIRLHVIANSDLQEDQELKLIVRDRVLAEIKPLLSDANDRGEAAHIISENIHTLENAARKAAAAHGYDHEIHAAIGFERFMTRAYESFTLPAGQYKSLRVEIGRGGGQNWWCVLFPMLCTASADSVSAASDLLSEDEAALITSDGTGVAVRFRALELIERIRRR